MTSLHHGFTSPRTRIARAAATGLRNVATMVLVSALLGSSALLAGCDDDGAPASTDAGGGGGVASGDGGRGGEGGSGGKDETGGGEGGSGGEDESGGGDPGNPPGECAGSTEEANTDPDDPVQQAADRLVRDLNFPAVLVAFEDVDGEPRHYTAGLGDLETKAEVPVDGLVRIGSNSKAFTAAVVLQLVGEGKVDLDAPIETYLPNLVRGEGIDGNDITVRQLLQHTSGLADYDGLLLTGDFSSLRNTYFSPRELLDAALAEGSQFPPGDRWDYSNTNYILAGLLIEKVTGRPLNEEITRRIIDRIGLRNTYLPDVGEQGIRGCHPRGYHADSVDGPMVDATELDPSFGWAAGEVIATPSDLNRFFLALFGGELLEPAQLEEMRTTVEAPGMWPGAQYGLGLFTTPLSCGGLAWGHGGDIMGYHTRGGVSDDGRAVTVAITVLPGAIHGEETVEQAYMDVLELVDAALCD
ncbi:serine hydrolase domain-containing protein [Sorangium sp. So ce1097]|uniref:serine hydrolase domain-containing protein n=1 Tax=Sorangium sp. So ce1097 TaxID=3133330 RepID=UPI003F5FCF4C